MSNPALASGVSAAQRNALENFSSVGRLSDFVKGLNAFDGKPTELIYWITDVEGIFDLYKDLPTDSVEYGILIRSIRRKIVGEAADVLNSNNVLYDWEEIKNTLILYYRDQRDVQTLDFELTTIKKSASESLSAYFSRVNEILSSLIVQVQVNEEMNENAASHIDYFRKKALDSFIRGLEKPLSILLKTANVKTLSKAYQFCLEYHNLDLRATPFRNEHSSHPIPKPRELNVPSLPPRKPIPRYPLPPTPVPFPRNQNYFLPPRPQFQTPIFNPQRMQPPLQQQRQYNPLNQFQRYNPPLPRPEPMDVDHSIRSRNINYGNRPYIENKRPHPPSNQIQSFKRMAHPLEQMNQPHYPDYMPEEDDIDIQDELIQSDSYYYGEPITEETTIEQVEDPEPSTSSQTNFLEWNPSW